MKAMWMLVVAVLVGAGCEATEKVFSGSDSGPPLDRKVDVELDDPDGGTTTVEVVANSGSGPVAEAVRHMQVDSWGAAETSLNGALGDGKRELDEVFAMAVLKEKTQRYSEAISLYEEANQFAKVKNRGDIREGKKRCERHLSGG